MDGKQIIGVTGGVGAGKSTVLEVLRTEYKARILLADTIAHELMEPGTKGLLAVTKALGTGFIGADGAVDRNALAALLFQDPKAKKIVDGLIHPMVWEEIKRRAETAKERLVIIEAAVFETAPKGLFDEIWYIYASRENRILRLMENRGYSREKCEAIIAGQASEEQYRQLADRIIDNNKGREEIKKQLEEIFVS